ncbi:MAG: glycosyltransferase [Bacilli bacterium]|nr:glycosyltransferase [Bacilli bacterium]
MIKKIINKFKNIIKPCLVTNKNQKLKKLFEKMNIEQYKNVIIFENGFGWEGIMKQRPQQIALNMPSNVLFLYHSNKDKYDNKECYKKIKDNLYMVNLDLYRKCVIKHLKDIPNKYLMIYSTNNIKDNIINNYTDNGFKIIYEYIDDIDEELSGKRTAKKLLKNYYNIINNDNSYIVCTATNLYNNVLKDNKGAKVKLITNGCDYNHFKKRKHNIPNEIKEIKKSGKPIIGYYGALASWFDYELIKKISNTNKYEVVLIGIKYDDSFDKSDILKLDNIHYLGKIDYDELPAYSRFFDVSIIPFVINDITLSTSPVKVFEYMASEKPIVTTDLPECRKYKSILISKDHKEFINNLEKAIGLIKDDKYMKILRDDALNNTWESKCNEMISFVNEV